METKAWYQSRTVQIAIAQAILGIITALTANDPTLHDIGLIAVVKSILDFFLRISTDTPIR